MVLRHGQIHEYLGMTINFTETGKVRITMYAYVDEMICKLPTELRGQSATPAFNYFFEHQEGKDDLLTP